MTSVGCTIEIGKCKEEGGEDPDPPIIISCPLECPDETWDGFFC